MQQTALKRAALILMTLLPATAVAADTYWGYSYRNIDITADGASAYAVNLARYCVRLDTLLTRILGIKATTRVRTHIYALPAGQLNQFLGTDTVSYSVSLTGNTILMENVAAHDSDYWGAYYGYTASLLASDGRLRGPDWYMHGVPQVFADTRYQGNRAQLGNVTRSYALRLGRQGKDLIPMRRFLILRRADTTDVERPIYDAQSWALAHEVFLESWHRPEFGKYLDLMRQGTDEAAAYASSFRVSYEELDKEFAKALGQRAVAYTMTVSDDAPAASSTPPPYQLSPAEIKARLALASARYNKGPDPVQLANEVLRVEPANESALQALAIGDARRGAYAEALATVDKLAARGESPGAYSDTAWVLAELSRAVADGKATLSVDAAALQRRANEDYARSLKE